MGTHMDKGEGTGTYSDVLNNTFGYTFVVVSVVLTQT